MNLTPYQAKYFAHELTKRCASDSAEKLAGAVASAQVDLNPHQVDAALFAFNSPFAKGALLVDEVGLGKTIEAGLVLAQKWAERKRRILVITPSNLRKQWYQEITEKFFLPCRILEAKSYNAAIRKGDFRPFEANEIVICSYQFACGKAADVANTAWDLVVIDEAHRLRNVYKPANIIANTLKRALANAPKLLLTATPLQNSLLELFGLVSFIDEHTFGDLKSFREQFTNLSQEQVFETLKFRLKPICHRTLRRQVTSYIPYTKRLPLLENFTPDQSEDQLYHAVSNYLLRENLQALPASQRSLMLMQITEHELAGHADFLNDSSFRLHQSPFPACETEIPLGLYELPRRSGESHLYRLNHPLAELVVEQALRRDLPPVTVQFDYSGRSGKVSLLEPLLGASGWLSATLLSVEALDQAEDHLILTGMTDLGAAIDPDVLGRMIHLPGTITGAQKVAESMTTALSGQTMERQNSIQRGISERNAQFFSAEADKLDGWADDLKLGLERDIKELDRLIKDARRAATAALTLEEKLVGQKQIRTLEGQRNEKRRSLFDAQDTVDKQRDALIQNIESKLAQKVQLQPLFQIRWEIN